MLSENDITLPIKPTKPSEAKETKSEAIPLQAFSKPLKCEISNDGKTYKLLQGFYYYRKGEINDAERIDYFSDYGKFLERKEVKVPYGFISDGFTNMGFHQFIPKFGKGLKCAILHDYLCEAFHKGEISRKEADSIFLESMLETKAFNPIKCYVIYLSVRAFALIKGFK